MDLLLSSTMLMSDMTSQSYVLSRSHSHKKSVTLEHNAPTLHVLLRSFRSLSKELPSLLTGEALTQGKGRLGHPKTCKKIKTCLRGEFSVTLTLDIQVIRKEEIFRSFFPVLYVRFMKRKLFTCWTCLLILTLCWKVSWFSGSRLNHKLYTILEYNRVIVAMATTTMADQYKK